MKTENRKELKVTRFPVHIFEEHSSTLPIWWQYRTKASTVVYLDAHLDLQGISEANLQALKQCSNVSQVKALEAPHHLNLSSHYAYGIENFLYPAAKLNYINRLIWVVPPHLPRSYKHSLLEYIQQMDGISFDELTGFKECADGSLRGHLLGLDITLCKFDQLNALDIDNNFFLDIDIDFFVKVPEDQLWIDPGIVIQKIIDQLGSPIVATVSRAVSSGHTPLAHRFVGDYVNAVLHKDDASVKHFHRLYRATILLEEGQNQQALTLCQQNIDTRPKCAASHFMLGHIKNMASARSGLPSINHAISIDPKYAESISQLASGYPNRHRKISSSQLADLTEKLEQLPADDPQRPQSEVAMGCLYAEAGMLKEAWQLLQKQHQELENHADLLLTIARAILASDQPQQARPLLEIVVNTRRTRSTANLYLGDLAFRAGQAKVALAYYAKVSLYAPAWILPLERQQLCLEKLSDTIRLNEVIELISTRKQELTKLVVEPSR